jgi:hypothetical protein
LTSATKLIDAPPPSRRRPPRQPLVRSSGDSVNGVPSSNAAVVLPTDPLRI